MNSTQQLSDKKYSSRPYFSFVLKQNWQNLALFIIIVILAMILPTFMFLEDLVRTEEMGFSSAQTILDEVEDIARNISFIGLILSGAFAVIAGMGALSYVNSEKNVGCYHSFPMKRESMFFTETLTRLIYYFVSIILGYTVSYFMVYTMYPQISEFTVSYINIGLVGVIFFLLIYSVMMFAAGLTGSAVMRLLMTFVIFFLPVALYLLTVYCVLMNSGLEESYYLNESAAKILCPIYDIAVKSNFIDKTGITPFLMYLPVSAAFYIGAMLLHKFRKSESSGTTIIWKPVFVVVKYLVIFAAGLLGVIIFGSGIFDGSEIMAYIIGALMGLVISFIVVNCIFYRSSKAMFRGIKTFIVFTVCFAVFMVLFVFNAYGIVGKPYSPEFTKKIELITSGQHIVLEDKEDIKLITDYISGEIEKNYYDIEDHFFPYIYSEENDDLIEEYYTYVSRTRLERENGQIEYGKEEYVDEYGIKHLLTHAESYSNYLNLTMVQVPVLGIPVCRNFSINIADEVWQKISETEEFEASLDLASWIETEKIDSIDFCIGGDRVYIYNNGVGRESASIQIPMPYYDVDKVDNKFGSETNIEVYVSNGTDNIEELIPLLTYSSDKAKRSAIVGYASIYYDYSDGEVEYSNRGSITYPIYAEDIELINSVMTIAVRACEINGSEELIRRNDYSSGEDYISEAIKGYNPSFLVDMHTGEAVLLENDELMYLLEKTSVMPEMNRHSVRPVVCKESTDYALVMSIDTGYNGNTSVSWHLFREGAIDGSELDSVFESGAVQP